MGLRPRWAKSQTYRQHIVITMNTRNRGCWDLFIPRLPRKYVLKLPWQPWYKMFLTGLFLILRLSSFWYAARLQLICFFYTARSDSSTVYTDWTCFRSSLCTTFNQYEIISDCRTMLSAKFNQCCYLFPILLLSCVRPSWTCYIFTKVFGLSLVLMF